MGRSFTNRRTAWITPLVALGVLVFVALAASGTGARDHPGNTCHPVPDTWAPSLDEVRNYLEEKSKDDTQASQRELTQTSQLLADISDAQLFIAYVQLVQALDLKARDQLFEEQKRWLDKRAEAARASVTSKAGTLGMLEYSSAFARLTKQRLATLQKRLQLQVSTTREGKGGQKP